MEKFRNLSNNIFFKIFLGFLGLTFVMFGISGFILGNKGSWIAKVGNKTISYDDFLKTYQAQRESIYRSSPSKEVLKYLDSDQFKQDLVSRIISTNLIIALKNDYQIYPSADLILQEIISSPALKGKDGKFNRALYQNFLISNNLTEKKHIEDISTQIAGSIIVQSFSADVPVSDKLAKALYKSHFETRNADIITINIKNVGEIKAPNDFELTDFFNKNKDHFALPEMRKVSYIMFDKSNLNEPIKVSEEEIAAEYKKNITDYQTPETRSFYQILFDDEKDAEEFLKSLKSFSNNPNANKADVFARLAMSKNKNKNSILLEKISKKDLPAEIAGDAFALQKNQYSDVLKSKLGYHIFYLLDVTPITEIALDKVKSTIKTKLIADKEETHLQDQLNKIDEELLATKSLDKVAEKHHFSINKDLDKISAGGLNTKQEAVVEIKNLDQFAQNAFSTSKGDVSRLFYSKTNDKYYAILVEEIDASRQRSLSEVSVLATDLFIKEKKQEKLAQLAQSISDQINKGGNASAIAAQNGLKIEQNKSFPRFYMIDVGGGKKVPYANKFLNQIFDLKINQASTPSQTGNDEFAVAVLKQIKEPADNKALIEKIKQELADNFKGDILANYNQYIENKFPVKINKKLLKSNTPDQTDSQ